MTPFTLEFWLHVHAKARGMWMLAFCTMRYSGEHIIRLKRIEDYARKRIIAKYGDYQ